MKSSEWGMAQPPWVNPFRGPSSGPPGDWMTPSTVTWVMAMMFLMVAPDSYSYDERPAGLRTTAMGGMTS